VVFNSVINSCAKAGQLGKAEKWVRRMLEAGFRPDDKTYNCLTHACGRNKDVSGLWSGKMMSTGVGTDAMTFSTLIASCAKAGKIDIACEWLEEMEKQGFEPNRVCYNCILRACSLQGDVKTAMHFWILLNSKGQGPNTESYNCMIGTFLQVGEPHLAVEWSQRMLKAGQQPDSVTMSMFQDLAPDDLSAESGSSITASICKLLQAGAFEKVQICLEHMKRLKFVVSEELIEHIILECLSLPSGGAASRSTTMSTDFQDCQSEASTTTPMRPFEESAAQSLMQSLLPNIAVEQLSGGTVILSF